MNLNLCTVNQNLITQFNRNIQNNTHKRMNYFGLDMSYFEVCSTGLRCLCHILQVYYLWFIYLWLSYINLDVPCGCLNVSDIFYCDKSMTSLFNRWSIMMWSKVIFKYSNQTSSRGQHKLAVNINLQWNDSFFSLLEASIWIYDDEKHKMRCSCVLCVFSCLFIDFMSVVGGYSILYFF